MLERINGFSEDGVLGYFQGKNAFVSIAVGSASNVAIAVTGAVSSYVGLQHFLNTDDVDEIVDFLNGRSVTRVDGTAFVAASVATDYTAAYAAQTNVRRIIDVVQQRAVIIATSDIAAGLSISGFKNAPNGVSAAATVSAATAITFLVERADVFDKDITSFQGVPTTEVDVGRLLIDDLTGVPLLDNAGAEVKLLSSATAGAAGNFGIKIYKTFGPLVS